MNSGLQNNVVRGGLLLALGVVGCVFLPGERYPCSQDQDCLPPFIRCDTAAGVCGGGGGSSSSSSSTSSSTSSSASSSSGQAGSSGTAGSSSSGMAGSSSSNGGASSSSSGASGVCAGGAPGLGLVAPSCAPTPVTAPAGAWVDGAVGSNVYGLATTVDGAGNVYAAGHVYSSADVFGEMLPPELRRDVFVVSLDPSGTRRWFTRWTQPNTDDPSADMLAMSPDGTTLWLAGSCSDTLTLVGGDGTADLNCAAGVGGSTFLARLNPATGAVLGVHLLPRALESVDVLLVLPDGDLVVGATFQTRATFPGVPTVSVDGVAARDMVVARVAGDLTATRWVKRFASGNEDRLGGGALDGRGGLFVAGSLGSPLELGLGGPTTGFAGFSDAVLVRLHLGTGAVDWHRTLGGSGFDDAFGVAVTADGTALWHGAFSNGAQVDAYTLTSSSERDGFLVRVANDNSALDLVTFPAAGYNAIVAVAAAPCGDTIRLASVVAIDLVAGCGTVPATTPPEGAMVLLELDGQLKTRWAQTFLAGGANSYLGRMQWLADGSTVLSGQVRQDFHVGSSSVLAGGSAAPFVLKVASP